MSPPLSSLNTTKIGHPGRVLFRAKRKITLKNFEFSNYYGGGANFQGKSETKSCYFTLESICTTNSIIQKSFLNRKTEREGGRGGEGGPGALVLG